MHGPHLFFTSDTGYLVKSNLVEKNFRSDIRQILSIEICMYYVPDRQLGKGGWRRR